MSEMQQRVGLGEQAAADAILDQASKEIAELTKELEAAQTLALPSGALADAVTIDMGKQDALEEAKAKAEVLRALAEQLEAGIVSPPQIGPELWLEEAGRFAPAEIPDPDPKTMRRESESERMARRTHNMLARMVDGQELARAEARFERFLVDPRALHAEITRLFDERPAGFAQQVRALKNVVERPQVPSPVKADFAERLKTMALPDRYTAARQHAQAMTAKARYLKAMVTALETGDVGAADRAANQYAADMGTVAIHAEAMQQLREARSTEQAKAQRAADLDRRRKRRWQRITERTPAKPVRVPGVGIVMPAGPGGH